MHSDRADLLAAIRAHPEEDTPRLMYADWLDEQGDEAALVRAEFIRLQCEVARLFDDDSDSHPVYEFLCERDYVTRPSADWTRIDAGIHQRLALVLRSEDLLKRHAAAWEPKLPKALGVGWSGFHRGFPHRVSFAPGRPLDLHADRLRASAPAVTLVAPVFTSQFVEQLTEAGLLGWVCGLEVRDNCAPALRAFGHRPEAACVRAIKVQYGAADEVVSALVDSPHWTGLRALDLSETVIGSAAAEDLFRAKHLRTLKRLHVHGDHWPVETFRAFAAGGFEQLTSLRFHWSGLDDAGAEALAACPALARLRKLDLDHNSLTGRGVTEVLCSPHLARVAFLGLEGNSGARVDAKRLAATEPAGLRMFHAHGCRFLTPDVRALARCPRLSTLWYLDLDSNGLGTAAVRGLIRGFGTRCPPILWMTHNRIDDAGAAAIANWKAAAALRVLHLRFNEGMTDTGVRSLLESPNLANLDGLGVSTTDPDLAARLKARFRHHEIEYP
jgi:uncharacterized protein (TIGR02996 family)